MIILKNKQEIAYMRTTGHLLADVFAEIAPLVIEGVSTKSLDEQIEKMLVARGLISQSKGYMGYLYATCISINEEIVHGVPDAKRFLHQGDLVKIDICARRQGFCADMARCFVVGTMNDELRKFVEVAYQSLDAGIKNVVIGKRLGDVSAAIQRVVESAGCSVVREFAGHGIGMEMHEDPEVLNYGAAGTGSRIKEGMAIAIEPMITQRNCVVKILSDGWTAIACNGGLAAHVEDTVIATEHGPEVITRV